MEKDYEVALSYAHEDGKVAGIIREELKNIFSDRFFMDVHRPEELANAAVFEKALRGIFQRTNYPIILYSKNYCKGKFTLVEQEEIMKRASQEEEPHLFIINIDDYGMSQAFSENYSFMLLNLSDVENEGLAPEERIHDIIHNSIKRYMIKQSIREKKKQTEYSLNIQTLFTPGNDAIWLSDYDWNLSGRAYINEGDEGDDRGRKIKRETTWQEFWKYVEEDFLWIKKNLTSDIMRRIRFNCHLSIAYKLGQIYGDLGQASGNRNLTLVSSNSVEDIVFTLERKMRYVLPEDFDICHESDGNSCECKDIVCIISIKPKILGNIVATVKSYLEEQGIKYSRICLFQKEMCIKDADTLESIAEYLEKNMSGCRLESKCKIHLFPDTTAPLMFVLGAKTIVQGKIQLYEYIQGEDSYVMSLER